MRTAGGLDFVIPPGPLQTSDSPVNISIPWSFFHQNKSSDGAFASWCKKSEAVFGQKLHHCPLFLVAAGWGFKIRTHVNHRLLTSGAIVQCGGGKWQVLETLAAIKACPVGVKGAKGFEHTTNFAGWRLDEPKLVYLLSLPFCPSTRVRSSRERQASGSISIRSTIPTTAASMDWSWSPMVERAALP